VAGQAPFILGNIQNFAFLLIPDKRSANAKIAEFGSVKNL
jgi:hypothetical protein